LGYPQRLKHVVDVAYQLLVRGSVRMHRKRKAEQLEQMVGLAKKATIASAFENVDGGMQT
jgi:hypothetical protein